MFKDSVVKDLEDEVLAPIKEAGGVVKFVGQYPVRGEIRFALPDDTEVHCEITAMGLEDVPSAKKKLKSKKYTCAFVPEVQTLSDPGIISEVVQRINRFPTDSQGGIYWDLPLSDGSIRTYTGGRLWCDYNLTDKRHWFYKYVVTDNVVKDNGRPIRQMYKQPPILMAVRDPQSNFTYKGERVRWEPNPDAASYIRHAVVRDEAGEVVPGSEYNHWQNQIEQMNGDDASIAENILGEWGYRTKGKPVYTGFSEEDHVSSSNIPVNRSVPIIVGVDGGFNNAFVFAQIGFNGKLQIIDEINNTKESAKPIDLALEQDVIPLLNQRFYGCKVEFVLDPSMYFRDGGSGVSQSDYFSNNQLNHKPAPTQDPEERIKNGRWFIDTRHVVEIDKKCTELVSALSGGFNYKLRRNGVYDEQPDKTSEYSHIGDAYGYLCSQVRKGFGVAKKVKKGKPKSMFKW